MATHYKHHNCKFSEETFEILRRIQQAKNGVNLDQALEDCVQTAAEVILSGKTDDVLKQFLTSETKRLQIGFIKKTAHNYLTSGFATDEDWQKLVGSCDECGVVLDDIVSQVKDEMSIRSIEEQFSSMTPAQKAILEIMEQGQYYSKQLVVDKVMKKTGCTQPTVERAKKALGIESKRIAGTNRFSWYIPEPDQSEENNDFEMMN